MKKICFLWLLAAAQVAAFAKVRLPAVLGNHMVLQQNTDALLWGWSEPGEKITIRCTWDTATYTTVGTANANWQLTVKTPAAGGPHKITITGYNRIELDDVLIGEVWLCSGQSNMQMDVGWGLPYAKEVSEATNKNIRFFFIPRTTSQHPQDDLDGRWVVCTPDEMKRFSAVGYFFGKDVTEKLAFPVGLIGASWGGTPAEVWTPDSVIAATAALKEAAQKLKPAGGWPVWPGGAYNAMIYPLRNFPIAGSLWYQGESNTGTWDTYYPLLTSMIASWRKDWKKDFPFYLVQIAPYAGYGGKNISALLREQQTRIATYPRTGMVVIHDLVDNINDIHPKMKKEVGQRLAALALSDHYNITGINARYPQYQAMKTEGDKIRILFTGADGGLLLKGKELTDFFVAGEDKIFVPAKAKIEGSTVVVSSKDVRRPVAVRYGFSNSAMPNLFSKGGLPVNIFRTDNWEVDRSAVKR
ncbi:MAG TPA: sialate O-acetylesterase [Flavisolibacter sp.]|nr:sialate O-acetylesterase [Flavisolibacter sp.]